MSFDAHEDIQKLPEAELARRRLALIEEIEVRRAATLDQLRDLHAVHEVEVERVARRTAWIILATHKREVRLAGPPARSDVARLMRAFRRAFPIRGRWHRPVEECPVESKAYSVLSRRITGTSTVWWSTLKEIARNAREKAPMHGAETYDRTWRTFTRYKEYLHGAELPNLHREPRQRLIEHTLFARAGLSDDFSDDLVRLALIRLEPSELKEAQERLAGAIYGLPMRALLTWVQGTLGESWVGRAFGWSERLRLLLGFAHEDQSSEAVDHHLLDLIALSLRRLGVGEANPGPSVPASLPVPAHVQGDPDESTDPSPGPPLTPRLADLERSVRMRLAGPTTDRVLAALRCIFHHPSEIVGSKLLEEANLPRRTATAGLQRAGGAAVLSAPDEPLRLDKVALLEFVVHVWRPKR